MRSPSLRVSLLALFFGPLALAQSPTKWVSTWTAPPDQAGPAFKAQTLRQVVRVSAGGSALRLRFSNLFGDGPLTLGPVHVALSAGGSAIQVGSDHALTFHGQTTVTIPKGESALSDTLAMEVAPRADLAVSLHLPTDTGASTLHGVGLQTMFFAKGGDATAALTLPPGETDDSRYFLTDVEVAATSEPRLLVAVGDSTTDGVGTPLDRNLRWTDALHLRLQQDPKLADISVVNAGIAGNRILHDASDPFVGPSTLARFERDVLSKPGLRWVVLLQGINDITAADVLKTPEDQVSAAQIIEGMKALIARAHAKGVKIFGGTLLPRGGAAGSRPHTPAAEARRQAVNAWVRTGGAFDGVIDFERAVADPAHPERQRPDLNSGDHTHPNEVGTRAMAAAVDLRLLR